jgi:hypothetical protein
MTNGISISPMEAARLRRFSPVFHGLGRVLCMTAILLLAACQKLTIVPDDGSLAGQPFPGPPAEIATKAGRSMDLRNNSPSRTAVRTK